MIFGICKWLLCEHFIAKANKELKTTINAISKEALEILQRYSWRGNIRELRNTIYSACLNASNDTIDSDDVMSLELSEPLESDTIEHLLEEVCKEYLAKEGIEKAKILEQVWAKTFLHVSFGVCPNITQLSNALEISRNTLKKQLREFGIYKEEE